MYTIGVWNVKPGKEGEFVQHWQAGVDGYSPDLPGIVFRLLESRDEPLRFLSVAGPWRNFEQYEGVRSSERFQEMVAAAGDLLGSFEISAFDLVAEVS
jgi:hypothetical protein